MGNRGFDFNNMRDSLNRVVEDALNFAGGGALKLPIDVIDTNDTLTVLSVPLLGVVPESLDISVSDDYLMIKGETAPVDHYPKSAYLRRERRYGSFERKVLLPVPVQGDAARAELLKNGTLRITLPKRVESAEETVVQVTSEPVAPSSTEDQPPAAPSADL